MGLTPLQRDMLIRDLGQRLKLPYPMGLVEMLEKSLEIYRQNFILFFGLALIPALLGTAFGYLWQTMEIEEFKPLLIAVTVIIAASYGAQIWAAGQAILGKRVGFGEAWVFVLKRLGALLLTMFIALIPTVAGIVLCCVGVLFTTIVFFAMIEQVVLLEGIAYFRAIARHFRLVFPNWEWGRVLGFFLAIEFIVILVRLLVGWGGMISFFGLEIWREVLPLPVGLSFLIVGQIWNLLTTALVSPYGVVFVTLLYFELRARREAYDLTILLERWEALGG
ncbi:MAG: hypothetical protein ACUVSC_09635 [Candidatus Fervidibacter sp.]|uniref:hypothetical protein n=1 Tax=Candidatus Fervidibacter sp. TaxID=3100871 RepID=UPI00404AC981